MKTIIKDGKMVGTLNESTAMVSTTNSELKRIMDVWNRDGIETMVASPDYDKQLAKGVMVDSIDFVPVAGSSIGLLITSLENLGFEVK